MVRKGRRKRKWRGTDRRIGTEKRESKRERAGEGSEEEQRRVEEEDLLTMLPAMNPAELPIAC